MSLASLRSEVSACRAWERMLHAGSPQTRAAAALPGKFETWLPILMAQYGLFALGTGFGSGDHPSWAIWPWILLVSKGRIFPRTEPTEWEALRLPSRRGWLLARWSLRVPHLLLLGACTLVHNLLIGMRDYPDFTGIHWPILMAVFLSPFLAAILSTWFTLQSHAGEGQTLKSLGYVLVLLALLLTTGWVFFWTLDSGIRGAAAVSGILAATAFVFLLFILPSAAGPLRRDWRSWSRRGIGPLLFHAAAGFTGILAGVLAAVVVLIPPASLLAPKDSIPGWVFLAPLASIFVAIAVVGANSLYLVERIDLGMEPRTPVTVVLPRVKGLPVRRGYATWPAGAGLRAAAWALYRGGWRTLRHPWLVFFPKILWECRAPALGMGAIVMLAFGSSRPFLQSLMALWIPPLLLVYIPRVLRLPASRRLHLLGADFAAVARHNLKWGLLTEVLPAALGGGILFLLPMDKDGPTMAARAGAWLGVVGFLALRQGAGFTAVAELLDGLKLKWGGMLVLLAAAGLGWWLATPMTLAIGGTILFAIAAHSTFHDFRDPSIGGKRVEKPAADD